MWIATQFPSIDLDEIGFLTQFARIYNHRYVNSAEKGTEKHLTNAQQQPFPRTEPLCSPVIEIKRFATPANGESLYRQTPSFQILISWQPRRSALVSLPLAVSSTS